MAKIRFKKLRLWLAYPVFIIYPFVAKPTDLSYWAGVAVVFSGMALRFWASGHIRKSRTLTTSGPYARTRNPLYVGNFIIGLGVMLIANNFWLVFYYAIAFSILYRGTIREEEAVLKEKFGAPYLDYCAGVPAFFPSIKTYRLGERSVFSLQQSFKNGEFIRLCGFLMVLAFFYLWLTLAVKKAPLNLNAWVGFYLFIVFFGLLWFNIYVRRKADRKGEMK